MLAERLYLLSEATPGEMRKKSPHVAKLNLWCQDHRDLQGSLAVLPGLPHASSVSVEPASSLPRHQVLLAVLHMADATDEISAALSRPVKTEEPLKTGHPGLWNWQGSIQAVLSPHLKTPGNQALLCSSQYYCIQ